MSERLRAATISIDVHFGDLDLAAGTRDLQRFKHIRNTLLQTGSGTE